MSVVMVQLTRMYHSVHNMFMWPRSLVPRPHLASVRNVHGESLGMRLVALWIHRIYIHALCLRAMASCMHSLQLFLALENVDLLTFLKSA